MTKLTLLIVAAGLLLFSCTSNNNRELIVLQSESFSISIDQSGSISRILDAAKGTNYFSGDTTSALMSVRLCGDLIPPAEARLSNNNLILIYKDSIEALIGIEEKDSHLTFELLSLSNDDSIDLIVWGPYPTKINKVIGETVGVVQGEEYAIGIQSLNPKTLGGYPWKENDCMPQIDIFEQDDYSDLSEEGKRGVLYRVEAAKPAKFGSTLQAYCRKRSTDRVIENWNHDIYMAPALKDGGYIGSKIALFGCPVDEALTYLGKIELEEGLPHPLIKGEWGKISSRASSAYMILGFGEDNVEEAIALTKKAGLKYLYQSGPFANWGHFELRKELFPHGYDGLKTCVEKANKEGVDIGLHTLSNFITTDDPYVSPVPDPRLAKIGSSVLSEYITASQLELPIESPLFFDQYRNNNLKTVMIGEELIRYGSVSETEPWRLLDCQRGAFNTKASSYTSGTEISKLADHGYKVFLTNTALSLEVAKNIAEIYNYTGVRQISFDGLEGNRSTGMGNYGEILFTKSWYDKLNEDIKSDFIADASRTSHYFWHIYTRMNWGEPWYDDFRESQTEYRLKNQKYFKRNLMPAMLGWFLMKPETSIEDIEWLLARSAAFNAGYAFVTSFEAIEKNGNSDKILKLIGSWEEARIAGLFTSEQKVRMEDIKNEFTLEANGENKWILREVYSGKFKHLNKVRQPGEPLNSTFTYANEGPDQTMGFILTAVDSEASDIIIEINNHRTISLPITLKAGNHIKYEGGKTAKMYNKDWQIIEEFDLEANDFHLKKGEHEISVDCSFSKSKSESMLKLELRTFGEEELLSLANN